MLEAYVFLSLAGVAVSWITSSWAAQDWYNETGVYPSDKLYKYRIGTLILSPFGVVFLFISLLGYSHLKSGYFKVWSK